MAPPAIVAGESAPRSRRHDAPGWLFIGYCYLGAVLLCVGFPFAAFTEPGLDPLGRLRVLALAPLGVLHWRLAGEVRRFTRWGWYGAVAELLGTAATKLVLFGPMAVFMVLFEAGWLRYFWRRRSDFEVRLRD